MTSLFENLPSPHLPGLALSDLGRLPAAVPPRSDARDDAAGGEPAADHARDTGARRAPSVDADALLVGLNPQQRAPCCTTAGRC